MRPGILGAAALAVLVTGMAADRAAATVVEGSSDSQKSAVDLQAVPGETNRIRVVREGTGVRITDSGAPVLARGLCVGVDAHSAVCPTRMWSTRIDANLGDGDDRFDARGVREVFFNVTAGPGADSLFGGDGRDFLGGDRGDDHVDGGTGDDTLGDWWGDDSGADVYAGGPGDDSLYTGPGPDQLSGGPGNDVLDPFSGRDAIRGDEGFDKVSYEYFGGGVTVRLDSTHTTSGNGAPGEDDSLTGVEDARGTLYADRLIGSDANNVLEGLDGDDVIIGGRGGDALLGGPGRDRIDARDGDPDRVGCGGPEPGDTADVDALDQVTQCSPAGTRVSPPPVSAPASESPPVPVRDMSPPSLSGTFRARLSARAVRRKGYRVTLTLNEPADVELRLVARNGGRARASRAGDLVLAELQRAAAAGATTYRLSVARTLRRHLRVGRRLSLDMVARDGAGNATRRSIAVRLSR